MQDYSAFVVGPDGHVTNRYDFSVRDDDAAREQARQMAFGHDMELWHHDRKLAEWRGERPAWLKVKRVAHPTN